MVNQEPNSAAATSFAVARKIVVAILGVSVLAFGIVLLALPGPGSIVIPLGLAILATEFVWARKLLRSLKQRVEQYKAGADRKPGEG